MSAKEPTFVDAWSRSSNLVGSITFDIVDGAYVMMHFFMPWRAARHITGEYTSGWDKADAFATIAPFFMGGGGLRAAKGGGQVLEEVIVHGNSLKSLKPTWGYKLFSQDGTFLKNGITSKLVPESRYTKAFMSDKYMVPFKQFPNRLGAYQWEFQQNQILRGPLNLNMH